MLKYLSAAVLAVGLLAAPALATTAGAAQPAAENTLITKPVADYAVRPKKPKRHYRHCCHHRHCCHYKKHKKHGPGGYKPAPGGYQPTPGGYQPAPKPYKPAPAKSGY